jgi:hypothetical protein
MATDRAKSPLEVADAFGRSMVDATLFSLRLGDQPMALRTGMGRLFGQYGQWPMNYIEFIRKMGARTMEFPSKGIPAAAAMGVMHSAAFLAGESLGVDIGNWVFFSPAGYRGGPYWTLVENLATAPEDSERGRQARKEILEFPLENIAPGGLQALRFAQAWQGDKLTLPVMLGFKPVADEEDTWIRWLQQLGR